MKVGADKFQDLNAHEMVFKSYTNLKSITRFREEINQKDFIEPG
jgi:hypothetical protein